MPPVGFEPTISAGERSQTYPSDRAATGTGIHILKNVVTALCGYSACPSVCYIYQHVASSTDFINVASNRWSVLIQLLSTHDKTKTSCYKRINGLLVIYLISTPTNAHT